MTKGYLVFYSADQWITRYVFCRPALLVVVFLLMVEMVYHWSVWLIDKGLLSVLQPARTLSSCNPKTVPVTLGIRRA